MLSRSQQDQLRKTISAFANSKGGNIFLGIDDSCVVHGVNMQENNRDEIKDRVKSIITERMIFLLVHKKRSIGTSSSFRCLVVTQLKTLPWL